MKIQVTLAIALVAGMASVGVWYNSTQSTAHAELRASISAESAEIQTRMAMGGIELDLKAIALELKLYRTIEERRALTPDEKDRKDYLEALRTVLLAEQLKKVA